MFGILFHVYPPSPICQTWGTWSSTVPFWIVWSLEPRRNPNTSVRRNANRGTGRKFCTHTQHEHNCHFGQWTLPCPKPFWIISVSDPSIYFAICVCSTCSNCSQSWWQWEWSFLFWLIFKTFFERDSSANNTGGQARVSRYCSMLSNRVLQYLYSSTELGLRYTRIDCATGALSTPVQLFSRR